MNYQEGESKIIKFFSEPMEERTTPDFVEILKFVWNDQDKGRASEKNYIAGQLRYHENQHFFFLADEYWKKIHYSQRLPKPTAVENTYTGMSICTIGGIEGRFFAALGARAVNIDPEIQSAPELIMPNLEEIPQSLNSKLSEQYKNQFDMVLSSRLIEDDSGFTNGAPRRSWAKHTTEFILLIMNILRPGGVVILRGNLVHLALNKLNPSITIQEIAPTTSKDGLNSTDTFFVFKKMT